MSFRSTKEWRQRREEFLKGKACEWCGSTERLVMHNRNPPPPYALLLRKISSEVLNHRVKEGEFSTQKEERRSCPECGYTSIRHRTAKKPAYKCQRCRSEFDAPKSEVVDTGRLSREDWDRFWGRHGPEIKRMVSEAWKKADEESRAIENYMALCNRCHMAARNGLVLCPVCRHGYMRPGRDMCWECFKKTDEGKEVAKRYELQAYIHPWCGKRFEIIRQWWGVLAEPRTCCVEVCDIGPQGCEEAKKRWDSSEDKELA